MENKPTHSIRLGPISGTVWENPGKDGKTFFTVKFTRTYRDKEGDFQNGYSFTYEQLPLLITVAYEVQTWLSKQAQAATTK